MHQVDADEERDPPPDPTPVDFPSVEWFRPREWNDETPPPNFQSLFTKILKPTDVSETHLKALNIDIRPPCLVVEMLPAAPDGSSYIPPLTIEQEPTADSSNASAAKATPGPARKRKDFEDRLAELRVDNPTAYRAIARNNKPGVKPPRLAYMRVFWQGLESMSQYWDCTLDQYNSTNEQDDSGEKSPKRQKLDTGSEVDQDDGHGTSVFDTLPVRTADEETKAGADKKTRGSESDHSPTHSADTPATLPPNSPSPPGLRYKGLRTNTGRAMPDQFRIETVRGFVEGTVWPFQCNVHPPRRMPLVHFGTLKLPVRQSAAVYRLPTDRARAKEGGIVGPILGVQVRAETEFNGDEGKGRLDVMREIGGLLQLAQERAREGKKEVKPGEGRWWTTVPRWGGGPGGEVEAKEGNSDVVALAAELLNGKDASSSSRKPPRQKKTPAMLWKELRPGSGYFDPKTDYMAIGKDPASEYDEVRFPSYLTPVQSTHARTDLGY